MIPLHSTVTVVQLIFCAAIVWGMKLTQLIEVDAFEAAKVQPYVLYILGFCIGIYSNARALEGTSVETVIVFRACTPLVVSINPND